MKHENMEHESLDNLLNLLRGEKIPECPAFVEANVLRTVRLCQAEAAPGRSFFGELLVTFLRPAYAAAALAIVIASSAATTAVATELTGRSAAPLNSPAQAADVFELQLLSHSDEILACCRPPSRSGR